MTPRAQVFKEWWAIRPAACRVAEILYDARGALVPTSELMKRAEQTRHGLEFSIRQLRFAMDGRSIINVMGEGFYMTTTGLAECDRALRDAAGREQAA